MKRYIAIFSLFTILAIISWGAKGHRAIASIAENHLATNITTAVHYYLNGQSMAEVSTWADEIRNEPQYKKTASWHFLNLPLGLSFEQFKKQVLSQKKENVYGALFDNEEIFSSPSSTPEQKAIALKFIIHLVGDLHQPMHISRAEDKGGNSIQVRFNGAGTNLHSLWDSKLIDHEGLNEAEIVKEYNKATPALIKKWQADEPMQWLWESYQISSQLYTDVEKSKDIDEVYYKQYIPVIHQRIEQGGIRLAGLLNSLLSNVNVNSLPKLQATTAKVDAPIQVGKAIEAAEAGKYIGKNVTVTAKVYGTKDFGSMVLVNVGAAYPDSPLTIVLRGEAKGLASTINGKLISVTGAVIDYKSKPEIVVTDPMQVKVKL